MIKQKPNLYIFFNVSMFKENVFVKCGRVLIGSVPFVPRTNDKLRGFACLR